MINCMLNIYLLHFNKFVFYSNGISIETESFRNATDAIQEEKLHFEASVKSCCYWLQKCLFIRPFIRFDSFIIIFCPQILWIKLLMLFVLNNIMLMILVSSIILFIFISFLSLIFCIYSHHNENIFHFFFFFLVFFIIVVVVVYVALNNRVIFSSSKKRKKN